MSARTNDRFGPGPGLTAFPRRRRPRIGLLGGSFNPAHSGHRHLSHEALKRLKLDRIWWLVSPQNPLKPARGMAELEDRIASATAIADDHRIWVTDIEARLGTRYTADTLRKLTGTYPHADFVWLMGADNLIQIPDWDRWSLIFNTVPVAIFARPSYSLRALAGTAARRFRHFRLPEAMAHRFDEVRSCFFIGRGMLYPVALEGALKL